MKVVTALLENFSVAEAILFTVILCLSVKGIVDFAKWIYNTAKTHFDHEHEDEQEIEQICNRLEEQDRRIDKVEENQSHILTVLETTNNNIDLLLRSDRDDIKSFITRQHHYFCYEKKWIDDYSLECIERRYSHYKEEGGNSFIGIFMEELRALPKISMDDEHGPDVTPI